MATLRAVKTESLIVDHGVSAPPADDILLVSTLMPEHMRNIRIENKEVSSGRDTRCSVQGTAEGTPRLFMRGCSRGWRPAAAIFIKNICGIDLGWELQ
jgi:hypothetical protein